MTNFTSTRPPQPSSSPRWTALVFAFGTLLSGLLSAGLSFATAGVHSAANPAGVLPLLWPPVWVFWAVWIIIYPCWGVATYLVWEKRQQADVRGALVLYAISVLGALFFLPLSNLTANNPAVLTLLDANGLIGAYALAWLYTRYDRRALVWLLPYLVWMPLTLALKLWLWWLNA